MNIKPFVAWCLDHGITSSLEIKTSTNGDRYTVLNDSSNTDNERLLVQCPLEMSIVASTKEELADRLRYERQQKTQSLFAPYIDILPTSFPDLPRFWEMSEDSVVPDGGAFANELVLQRKESSKENDDIAWAMACVDSRANALPNGSYGLTPMLDMINHDGSVDTSASIDEEASVLSLSAVVPPRRFPSFFGAAPEVKISYGPLTNLQTLMDYGFVESDNPHNRESISVSVIRKTPVRVTIDPEGRVDRKSILDLLSSLSLVSEELDYIVGKSDAFQSRRNEIEVYALILGYLEEALYDVTSAEASSMPLLNSYIKERQKLLQLGMDKIVRDFPELAV